uniref:thioredoxin-dependent peroxiredoxin n=1 Tax=Arcella intermedia TaxID=1963864 RepID=A0A6B2LJW7_9EUKA
MDDYKGKWVVLFFYPLDFTFVCPTEIIAFSEAAAQFSKINTEVIGVSVDSNFTHLAWVNTPRKQGGLGEIHIPLIGDVDKRVSTAYGALYKNTGHTLRATYVIDPTGTVRHVTLNDPPVGRNVNETLRIVEGYQYVEQHGEVCPAGWTKGADTIKPNPTDKLQYFGKVNK